MACGDNLIEVPPPPTPDAVTSVDGPPMESPWGNVCWQGPFGSDLSMEPCTAEKAYCCYYFDFTFACHAGGGGDCVEHPVGALVKSCNPKSGGGCPVEQPVCCREIQDGATYCTGHALYGSVWTCSGG